MVTLTNSTSDKAEFLSAMKVYVAYRFGANEGYGFTSSVLGVFSNREDAIKCGKSHFFDCWGDYFDESTMSARSDEDEDWSNSYGFDVEADWSSAEGYATDNSFADFEGYKVEEAEIQ